VKLVLLGLETCDHKVIGLTPGQVTLSSG